MDPQILREKSLDTCFQLFQTLVPKSHQFQTAYELLAWLQDDLLTAQQRISAIFILLEFNKQYEKTFLSTIADLADISPYAWQKLLLQQWVKNRDIGRLTQSAVMRMTGESRDLDNIKRSRAIRPVVNGSSFQKHNTKLGKFEPEFLRPTPEFFQITSNETRWLTPLTAPQVIWDGENQMQKIFNDGIKDLIKKALHSSINHQHATAICESLQSQPKLVFKCGITTADIIELVNNNSIIAIEIIVLLHNTSKFQQILDALIKMPLSLQALEVFNSLYMKIEIPIEALHYFISNCMQSCKNIKDAYMRKRLVRLLCVFIQSFMKNKFVSSPNLALEIQNFCTEFSDIKEANALYKSIKNPPAQQQCRPI